MHYNTPLPYLLITLIATSLILLVAGSPTLLSLTPEAQAASPASQAATTTPTAEETPPTTSVSSSRRLRLELQVLDAARLDTGGVSVDLALRNNYTRQGFMFDPEPLFQGAVLQRGNRQRRPESVRVEQGNVEGLPPQSAIVAHLRFPSIGEGPYRLRVPNFPPLTVDPAAPPAVQSDTHPLEVGRWNPDVGPIPSEQLSNIGATVNYVRVREDTVSVEVELINLSGSILTGVRGNVTAEDARLISGRGIAYQPTNVSGALAENFFPTGQWYPGETRSGILRFPRPTTGPLRLNLPAFPTLPLSPRQDVVTMATPQSDASSAAPDADLPVNYAQIQDFLQRVATQLEEGDREGLLQLFAGSAEQKVQGWLPGLQSLPITGLSWQLSRTGQATDEGVQGAEYLLTYQLGGDGAANQRLLPVTLDLTRQNGMWRITSWQSPTPLWTHPWEVQESEHFRLLADPQLQQEFVNRLLQQTEDAYEALSQTLPSITPRDRYLIVVPGTEQLYQSLAEGSDMTAGVTITRFLQQGAESDLYSLAILLDGAELAQQPIEEEQRTIKHELAHAFLAPFSRPIMPAWVVEGAATYLSEGVPWTTLESWLQTGGPGNTSLVSLTRVSQFSGDAEQGAVPEQYAYSAAVIGYLVETYGQRVVLNFYRDFARSPQSLLQGVEEAPGDVRLARTRELLQEHFDLSLQQLERDVQAWIQEQTSG